MQRAVDFLVSHPVAGLPLAPGGRKTSITLAAFCRLRELGKAQTMLVIAPLRVARQTWPAEVEKWTQFRHLNVALLHGSKKEAALKSGADLFLINPEGLPWLCQKFLGRTLPFDIVTIDELTRFKNSAAERHKVLRPRTAGTRYMWGLTGSLKPNTHMDLFGQQLILDRGEALGRYITHYRRTYFIKGFNGFDYDLMLGAERKISERMSKTWFYMDPADYDQLPPLIENPIYLEMGEAEKKVYRKLKNEYVASLPKGGLISAENAAGAYAKMSQLANGAIYKDDGTRDFHVVHELKLDALEELMDELAGQPLLLAYEFNHDLERIRQRIAHRLPGGELPWLGKGTTAAQETKWIADWNANRLPLLAAHPASAGHGLNLQEGNAAQVCWFSVPWDWEQYDQFGRRIRRSGNTAQRIFNHLLLVRGTLDETKYSDKDEKDAGHKKLLSILNEEILRDPSQVRTTNPKDGDSTMADKLPRPGEGGVQMPAGWGAPQQMQAPQSPPPGNPGGWPNLQTPGMQPSPGTVHQAPPSAPPAGWGAPPPPPSQEPVFPPEGWTPHPQAPGYFYKGQEVKLEAELRAMMAPATSPVPSAPPAGWGAPPVDQDQRARMEAMLTTGQPPAGFSSAVGAAMDQIAGGDYGPADQPGTVPPAGWGAPPAQQPPGAALRADGTWGAPPQTGTGTLAQRERGKPSPGKTRRTKEEVAEDAAWEAQQTAAGNQQYVAPPSPEEAKELVAGPAPTDTGWVAATEQVASGSKMQLHTVWERQQHRLRILEMLVASKLDFATVNALLSAAEELDEFVRAAEV